MGSAGRSERRRSERGVRGIVRSAASASAGSLPADGLPHGASSSKRGCKDMMLLTRYFRRRAPGPALRTGLVIGLAAILLAGLPEGSSTPSGTSSAGRLGIRASTSWSSRDACFSSASSAGMVFLSSATSAISARAPASFLARLASAISFEAALRRASACSSLAMLARRRSSIAMRREAWAEGRVAPVRDRRLRGCREST